jgi:hypothetical protein
LSNKTLRRSLETHARNYGTKVEWRETAEDYAEIFAEAARSDRKGYEQIPRPVEQWIPC